MLNDRFRRYGGHPSLAANTVLFVLVIASTCPAGESHKQNSKVEAVFDEPDENGDGRISRAEAGKGPFLTGLMQMQTDSCPVEKQKSLPSEDRLARRIEVPRCFQRALKPWWPDKRSCSRSRM
jgi:hypothetical protein